MVASRLLLQALCLSCLVAATVACSGADCAPGTLLLTSYDASTPVTTSSSWVFDPVAGTAELNRPSIRPPFATPEDVGSLRRDNSFYVPSIEMIYEWHSLAPTDGETEQQQPPQQQEKILLTEEGVAAPKRAAPAAGASKSAQSAADDSADVSSQFFSYSLFTNSSTLVQPVPGYSITCSQHDPVMDLVIGLSSVYTQNGTDPYWNVSLLVVEYNGDFYSYFTPFWTIALEDPVGAAEDPCRPQCAFDGGRGLFSFHWSVGRTHARTHAHWPAGERDEFVRRADTARVCLSSLLVLVRPAPAATPAPENRGTLYTVNVTYVMYTPVGELVAATVWPNNFVNPSVQPVVLGMAYSPAFPNALAYMATGALNQGQVGAVVGVVNPLTQVGSGLVLQQDQSAYESPRVMVTHDSVNPQLVVVESAAPFRFTTWAIMSAVVTTGEVAFSDNPPTSVLGVHSWTTEEPGMFQ